MGINYHLEIHSINFTLKEKNITNSTYTFTYIHRCITTARYNASKTVSKTLNIIIDDLIAQLKYQFLKMKIPTKLTIRGSNLFLLPLDDFYENVLVLLLTFIIFKLLCYPSSQCAASLLCPQCKYFLFQLLSFFGAVSAYKTSKRNKRTTSYHIKWQFKKSEVKYHCVHCRQEKEQQIHPH